MNSKQLVAITILMEVDSTEGAVLEALRAQRGAQFAVENSLRQMEQNGFPTTNEFLDLAYSVKSVTATEAPEPVVRCLRCGERLDKSGFCQDLSCEFSDHKQNCVMGWSGHPDYPQDVAKCTCGGKIEAEVHSDDLLMSADFIANLWFEQASDDEIFALSQADFGSDKLADNVARFCENEEIGELWDYLAQRRKARTPVGYECNIDQNDALRWIQINRPEVYYRIVGE